MTAHDFTCCETGSCQRPATTADVILGGYADFDGFGRDTEVRPGVWACEGPDHESHAIHCDFIMVKGILPCSCDATRGRYGHRDVTPNAGEWFRRWLRWAKQRAVPYARPDRAPLPWPVTGPDGDAWIPGIDFNE